MKITFLPKTYLGKWSVGLILNFFLFMGIFALFVNLGERGGETFFSNLKLTIPFMIAVLSGSGSFLVGMVSLILRKERSILVFLSSLLGFLILLFILGEFISPH